MSDLTQLDSSLNREENCGLTSVSLTVITFDENSDWTLPPAHCLMSYTTRAQQCKQKDCVKYAIYLNVTLVT